MALTPFVSGSSFIIVVGFKILENDPGLSMFVDTVQMTFLKSSAN